MDDVASGGFEASEATDLHSGEGADALGVQGAGSRKEKVKIDGTELEVDIDELKKDYQKFKSSEKRFQEAAELRKSVQQERELINDLLGRASKGDLGWLKGLVPNEVLTQWAENELLEHIEWQKRPEVEKRAIMAEKKAQELEARVQEFTQTKEREHASKVEEQAYQQIEHDIIQAVQELGYDYKVKPRFIRRIAEQLHANLEASSDPQSAPLSAKVARDRAWKGLIVDAQELLQTLPLKEALQLLPPQLREAVRKADVEEAMSQMPMKIRKGTDDDMAPRKKSQLKRMTTEEYFERLGKKFGK